MTVWFCTADTQKLFVAAERWYDAWDWARQAFHVDNPTCLPSQQAAEVELRFVGSDYGWHPNRHREVRRITDSGWGDWEIA
jgi:hypothetical protein